MSDPFSLETANKILSGEESDADKSCSANGLPEAEALEGIACIRAGEFPFQAHSLAALPVDQQTSSDAPPPHSTSTRSHPVDASPLACSLELPIFFSLLGTRNKHQETFAPAL